MNNAQLYIAVAIPSVLVVLGWLSNNTRLAGMERRMDSVELGLNAKIDKLDAKIDKLDAKVDRRFDGLMG